ncbi:hypothetical protein [Streptomyces turgidiscabies]|uniref:hypothetical protein n=1 Tax=Streptomyces turgidiscabies TaxID=85558 RepID=UPI0038F632B6
MTDSPAATARTDLSDLVVQRKIEIGVSYEKLAERCIDPESGEQKVKYSWLHRLATYKKVIPPDPSQLRALHVGLEVPLTLVQEKAGAQFHGVDTVWAKDEKVRAMVHEFGALDAEDQDKVQALMQSWRKLKRD